MVAHTPAAAAPGNDQAAQHVPRRVLLLFPHLQPGPHRPSWRPCMRRPDWWCGFAGAGRRARCDRPMTKARTVAGLVVGMFGNAAALVWCPWASGQRRANSPVWSRPAGACRVCATWVQCSAWSARRCQSRAQEVPDRQSARWSIACVRRFTCWASASTQTCRWSSARRPLAFRGPHLGGAVDHLDDARRPEHDSSRATQFADADRTWLAGPCDGHRFLGWSLCHEIRLWCPSGGIHPILSAWCR